MLKCFSYLQAMKLQFSKLISCLIVWINLKLHTLFWNSTHNFCHERKLMINFLVCEQTQTIANHRINISIEKTQIEIYLSSNSRDGTTKKTPSYFDSLNQFEKTVKASSTIEFKRPDFAKRVIWITHSKKPAIWAGKKFWTRFGLQKASYIKQEIKATKLKQVKVVWKPSDKSSKL